VSTRGQPCGSLFPGEGFDNIVLHLSTRARPDFKDYRINPIELGFIPPRRWKCSNILLSDTIDEFFKARPSKILRFEQKLWNALALTRHDPALYSQIGVKWLNNNVILVHRDVFGRFINVTRPSAALYNNQGSFMTHGFVELPRNQVEGVDETELNEVDESIVRLFRHRNNSFHLKATATQVIRCRYAREFDLPHNDAEIEIEIEGGLFEGLSKTEK
jgi:hypothetical protein